MKKFTQSKSFLPSFTLRSLLAAGALAGLLNFNSSLAQPTGPTNGQNGAAFPSINDDGATNDGNILVSTIKSTTTNGKISYYWDSGFRSTGYLGLYGELNQPNPWDFVCQNVLVYNTVAPVPQHLAAPVPTIPNPGTPFGSRLPINLFASPGPGDFLDPSPTLGGTSVALLPPGAASIPTGWNGLSRPTLDGALDLITGVPLARVVDLELPFDGATFRIARTRSTTREDCLIGTGEAIADSWWDWTGVGWMTGENPLLLIDSSVADLSASGNRTTWLVLDAFHSIPFQFIESAGQYEPPPRFRATLSHDGIWGVGTRDRRNPTSGLVESTTERGWLKRPRQYTVSLYDGQLKYIFVAIQKGGVQDGTNLRDNVADCEDVPAHIWDVRYAVTTDPHSCDGDCVPAELMSLAERPITPANPQEPITHYRDPYLPLTNPGLGLPTLGLLKRIEDNYGHIVEMHYSPVHQRRIRDANDVSHAVDPDDDRDDNLVEVFQDTFRRGQLHYVELKKAVSGNEQVLWTLVYAHRRFEETGNAGYGGWLRQQRNESTSNRFAQWLVNSDFDAFRDDLECYDGSLAIEAIYAYKNAVAGIDSVPPITISQHAQYPYNADNQVVLDGSDDHLASSGLPASWTHRIRHFYRYDGSPIDNALPPENNSNPAFAHTVGAPVLIKTTVTSYLSEDHSASSPSTKNTVYQYSNFTVNTPIEIRTDGIVAQPWTERSWNYGRAPWNRGIPWLDRIYTDDDISRLQTWAAAAVPEGDDTEQLREHLRAVSMDTLAAQFGKNGDSYGTLLSGEDWKQAHAFASIAWVHEPHNWPAAGPDGPHSPSSLAPTVESCLEYGYLSFDNTATHLFGSDNIHGTVSQLAVRSGDTVRWYQINRMYNGPMASTRDTEHYPVLSSGFIENGLAAGPGCNPMRSRFVAPYYWAAVPTANVNPDLGHDCWALPPDLETARWTTMVDTYDSLEHMLGVGQDSEATYNDTSALRKGMTSRQVIEINPSGVTIRDRHWDTKTGSTSNSQLGFARTYKYERAGTRFASQIAAIASHMPTGYTGLDAIKSELLMIEEHSLGWSAVDGGSGGDIKNNGLITFHDFDWVDYGVDYNTQDDVTTATPRVNWSSFVQSNAHGIRRGTLGTKYYTKQVFHSPTSLAKSSATRVLPIPRQISPCSTHSAAQRTLPSVTTLQARTFSTGLSTRMTSREIVSPQRFRSARVAICSLPMMMSPTPRQSSRFTMH